MSWVSYKIKYHAITSTCDFLKIYHLVEKMTFQNIRCSVYEKTVQEPTA